MQAIVKYYIQIKKSEYEKTLYKTSAVVAHNNLKMIIFQQFNDKWSHLTKMSQLFLRLPF